jgi:hypothetical protein
MGAPELNDDQFRYLTFESRFALYRARKLVEFMRVICDEEAYLLRGAQQSPVEKPEPDLFVPESDRRIDADCPPRREIAREDGHQSE